MSQILRYAAVGIAVNLLGYFAFLLLTFWGVDPKLAVTLLFISMTPLSFYWNNHWTFNRRGDGVKTKFLFAISHLMTYLLNISFLYVLVDLLGFGHQWTQLLITLVLGVVLYLGSRFIVFTQD